MAASQGAFAATRALRAFKPDAVFSTGITGASQPRGSALRRPLVVYLL
jgi:hypothetical protein